MNPLGSNATQTIGVVLRGDSSSYSSMLTQAATATTAFESSQKASASRWSTGWKVAAGVVALALVGIATGLTASARAAAEFETKMRNVNSLVQQGDVYYQSMSESVLEIARVVPQSAGVLADGLYDVTSSGFAGAQSLMVLEASAKAASAGMTETSNAVTGITAVLNAYGLSAASARDVSDVLFQTVNLGVIQFEELTGVLGNVVGLASAAKVPIEDVSAAIATMTLTGISSAEAGTSLNRVIQSLVQPSESLANLYSRLGYESGAAAVEQRGLYGVLEDVRQATGGTVTAYLQLFPEIRAARGAFALASAEGETYARIQDQMANATEGAGATQAAFAEQMKATENRLSILSSGLESNAVALGLKVLPAFDALIDAGAALNDQFVPALEGGLDVLGPFLSSLYNVGVNVVDILQALWETAEPVAVSLAKIAGSGVVGALTLLGEVLEDITGFLAENEALTVTLAALFLSRYLPSITQVTNALTQFGRTLQYNVIWRLSEFRAAQQAATLAQANAANFTGTYTRGLSRAGAAMRTTGTAARAMGAAFFSSGLATAGLTVAIGALIYASQTADQAVKEALSGITTEVNNLDSGSLERAVEDIQALRDSVAEFDRFDGGKLLTGTLAESGRQIGNLWEEYKGNKELAATNDALAEMQSRVTNATVNMTALRDETGLTFAEIEKLAAGQDIDLTDAFGTEEAAAAREKIVLYLGDIEKQTGITTDQMADDWKMSVEEMDAFAAAVEGAVGRARSAFDSSTDVVGTWTPDIGVEEEANALDALADAQENLADAQKKLNDARAKEGDNDSAVASAKDRVADAQERVTDAQERLTEAQAEKANGTLEAFYQNAIRTTENFSTNLDKAVSMGLDPAVVTKLLQEGPEQAGPIVEQMVSDSSGAMIEMVNEAEATLGDIGARVAEQARLTAVAVNSASDEAAKALPEAMEISSLSWDGWTTDEIAEKLGLDPESVREIAAQFGITLNESLVSEIGGSLTVPYEIIFEATNGLTEGGGRPVNVGRFATGGIVPGYTPGRDTAYIGVGGGEAVMRPEWTRVVGSDRVNYWNHVARTGGISALRQAMSPFLGAFANGGVVGTAPPQVVEVPVTQRTESWAPINIERLVAGDVSDFERQAREIRRRKQWGGRRG